MINITQLRYSNRLIPSCIQLFKNDIYDKMICLKTVYNCLLKCSGPVYKT